MNAPCGIRLFQKKKRREVIDEVLDPGEVGVAARAEGRTASARRRLCGTSRSR